MATNGYLGRVGVVIETAPGRFTSVRLNGTKVAIEYGDDDMDVTSFGSTARHIPSGRIRIELEGYLAGEEDTAAPEWATEPVAEIEPPLRELEG